MAVKNSTILKRAWLQGSNDFQQRVPEPTQSNIAQVERAIFDPMNRQIYNQFMDVLVNRIAFQYVKQTAFTNPLAVFKRQKITYGNTVQEIVPSWVKAHAYEDDVETLLKMHRPQAVVTNYSQNRRDKYAISISADELHTAFVDDTGLNNLIAAIMQTPVNSDEYDEMNIMLQLIAEYENTLGFYRHHLDNEPKDETSGKELLTALQTYGGKLQFPSSLYNNIEIPVFAKPEELVLLVTPETQASLNVNTLAALFNVELAKVSYRTVVIPEFPIPNAVALLTTEDFFVCNDTNYQTTSFWNPETLSTTYWLHHWGIYAASPCVPAILFTTDTATVPETVIQKVTGLKVTADSTNVARGDSTQINVTLTGSVSSGADPIVVSPDSAVFALSAKKGNGTDPETYTAVKLNSRTYIDMLGVLHVQKSGITAGTVITVTATATYINPSGDTEPYTATVDITVA